MMNTRYSKKSNKSGPARIRSSRMAIKPLRKSGTGRKKEMGQVMKQTALKLFANEEVEKFFVASLHPFSPNLAGVSNTSTSQPSHPYLSTTRNMFTLTAEQYLFIGVSPAMANNVPSLLTWVGTSSQLSDTYNGAVTAGEHSESSWNSPYALSDFNVADENQITGRLISAGVEVRYAGTELNRGGNIFFLEDDDHRPTAGPTSTFQEILTSVTGRQTVHRSTFNECATHQYTVGPVNYSEDQFNSEALNNVYPYAPDLITFNGTSRGGAIAWIIVKPAGAAVIDLTSIAHFEFIGKASIPMYRSVYAHPEETHYAKSAIKQAKQVHHQTPESKLLKLGVEALKTETKRRLKANHGDILKTALGAVEDVGKIGLSLAGLFI